MALAADAASDPALVLRALGDFQDLPVGGGHDDFEFLRFRALTRSMLVGPNDIERMMRCLTCAEATADHRVTAATLLLKVGDSGGNVEMGNSVVREVPEELLIAATDPIRLEYMLLRANLSGDTNSLADVARRLIVVARNCNSADRMTLQMNAVIALDRAGLQHEATDVAMLTFSDAEAAGAFRVCTRIAVHVCQLHLDRRDDAQALVWFERLARALDRPADTRDAVDVVTCAVICAWTLGRHADGMEMFRRADVAGVFEGSDHRDMHRSVSLLIVRTFDNGWALDDGAIDRLTNRYAKCAHNTYIRDVEIAIACRSLARNRRLSDARAVFSNCTARPKHQGIESRCLQDLRVELFPESER
jgi:hypothetical protein